MSEIAKNGDCVKGMKQPTIVPNIKCWKSPIPGPKFQNFQGGGTPLTPVPSADIYRDPHLLYLGSAPELFFTRSLEQRMAFSFPR